ncbi:response regulator [Magnetospirillum aberrantis]|uniref:Response regulator transcription factor n=1 Tax=Magnetospirillum aberrantis SpK TaxID=908842 RepID=A0A7C9UVB6_9PROT|nr:response regulator transcription factor [Magnetospirillum aberrantis]NFV79332.1 response regulator transcription factor [Magnetospirillum aberrantis SpK]
MKVLLADDHALFREGVRLVLESLVDGPLDVVEAPDYIQALAAVRGDSAVDVALVDLNMPGMDGFSGIEALKRAAPSLHLVVVSASEQPTDVRRALDAGAHGYITKASSSAAMLEAIRLVLSGETFVSPGLEVPDGLSAGGDVDTVRASLTPRQRDVLAMLRQGKSNKEIARDLDLAEITVKLHVTAILRALGVENRTQAAIMASKIGL